jgi:hypothetical protein
MQSTMLLTRRAVARRGIVVVPGHRITRSYHAASPLLADALDMVDTFDRRHSTYTALLLIDGCGFETP